MKRTKEIRLGLVASTAAALIGCSPQQPYHNAHRQCVDQNQIVVDDRYCEQPALPGAYPYRWYYYPSGSYYSAYGSRAGGGSFVAPTPSSRASSGTTRGVFGATAEGHGFSGGAGAGE